MRKQIPGEIGAHREETMGARAERGSQETLKRGVVTVTKKQTPLPSPG